MNKIGVKVYYDKNNGSVITSTNEYCGKFKVNSIDEDFNIYPDLKDKNKYNVGVIEFEYGDFFKLKGNNNNFKVNLETEKVEFYYEPINEKEFLSDEEKKIKELELKLAKAEYELMMGGSI